MHLSEDDLILRFYGEEPVEHESEVDAHLRACPTCLAVWTELSETLKMVDAAALPEPDADFERVMWSRVRLALPHQKDAGRLLTFFVRRRPASFVAASILAILLAGHFWPLSRTTSSPAPMAAGTAADAAGRERVLLTALDNHFQESEMLLVEVMNAPAAGGDHLDFERQTADDLLGSSRLYRVTAQQNGNPRLAQMLEDLESVFVEIARSPDKVDRKDFGSLRARIESDDLLFKVRAVSNQIHDRQQTLSTE